MTDDVESMNMDPPRNSEGPCCVKLTKSCVRPMHITYLLKNGKSMSANLI